MKRFRMRGGEKVKYRVGKTEHTGIIQRIVRQNFDTYYIIKSESGETHDIFAHNVIEKITS